ncbi:MAG: type II toxin-antitoxin system PemK/MazF family toxin [Coriobacteriia bacterium]|nr:type II toxin-antitoxin system PemK/MazF family toxin [Coriobacteriia bacterium]
MPVFGDVVLAAGGAYSAKPRPVLIFQSQDFNTGESVLVIPFTTTHNPNIITRLKIEPSKNNGLNKPCFLEIGKLSAISIACVGKRIGALNTAELEKAKGLAAKLLTLE